MIALPMDSRRYFSAALVILLAGSAIWYGAPWLFGVVRLARDLAPLSMNARREAIFGAWYGQATQIRASVPRGAVVDLVMVKPKARDLAVLAGAVLQPCVCQYFDGWTAWRARQRAAFIHDPRAANAPPSVPVQPARIVIAVDPDGTPQLQRVREAP